MRGRSIHRITAAGAVLWFLALPPPAAGLAAAPGPQDSCLAEEPSSAPGPGPASSSATYRLLPESRFEVRTGTSGALGVFGHDHRVIARDFEGEVIYDPEDPGASGVELTVHAGGLEVRTEDTSARQEREIDRAMREDVLRTDEHPAITFVSTGVEPGPAGARVTGDLTLRGETRSVPVDVRLEPGPEGEILRASGSFTVRQTDFGIEPYSLGLGTIRVADEIEFAFQAVARRVAVTSCLSSGRSRHRTSRSPAPSSQLRYSGRP